ncbi:MAG: YHS domain-containing (seleno)protein [Candidatus Tectimicrobiota bacterium]
MQRHRPCLRPLLLLCLLLAACTASRETILARPPINELNVKDTVALKGYDAVAYFTDARPVKGSPQWSYSWQGATWHFASPENRQRFAQEPEKYAPQYGGYCAYAIAKGNIADISPTQWAIVQGKLYLNNNVFAQSLWDADRSGHIVSGDGNWQITPRKPVTATPN